MSERKAVLIVEDDRATRAHLERCVSESPRFSVVGSAATLQAAREVLRATTPVDILMTDLQLPDGSGVELIREVRRLRPEVSILVISVLGDERSVISSIQAGASGYLLKDGDAAEVEQSLLDLGEGGSPLSPAVARYVLRLVQGQFPSPPPAPDAPAPVTRHDDPPKLSPREVEVLELLAKGFSPAEIAELWHISTHTVVTHTRSIHRKLQVSSRAAAIFEAVSLGIIQLTES